MLEANPLQLGEVVVTGAGTATEVEKLGNVRNTVSPELIVKSNEANVVQALAGKAPNVQVAQSSGDPGAGSKITIRGLRTINGSVEPLFIVDGVPMNNIDLLDDELQSDRRGSTTGVGGQDVGGELEGTSAPNRMMDLNPDRHRERRDSEGRGGGGDLRRARGERRHPHHDEARPLRADAVLAPQLRLERRGHARNIRCSDSTVRASCGKASAVTRSWGAPITGATYDHANEAFDTGHVLDNTLTVSGGNDRTTFYLSGNYNHNEGVFVGPNNYFNRAHGAAQRVASPDGGLTVGGNFSYADTRGHFTQRGNNMNGLLLGLFRTPPNFNNMP